MAQREPPPPHDLAAEQALIGAMLLTGDAVEAALEHTSAADFYRPAHADAFAAVARLHRAGHPVDTVTVAAELNRTGALDRVGAGNLVSWQASTPVAGNAAAYARIVADLANLRRAIGEAIETAEAAKSGPRDVPATIADAARRFDRLAAEAAPPVAADAGDLYADWKQERLRVLEGEQVAVLTPFRRVNELTGGLLPGGLVTVAARTGIGKTAFAANLAMFTAAFVPVLFVTLEMSAREIMGRLVSAAHRLEHPSTRISGENIRDMNLPENYIDSLWASGERFVKPLQLSVIDDATTDMARVAAAARGRRVVIYDYLQLAPGNDAENRQTQVAEATRRLKLLAIEHQLTVVALAQLNREAEREKGKKPQLWQIRESGAIEQDSNQVWILTPGSRGDLLVHVDKNREGQTTATGDDVEPERQPVRLRFTKSMGLLDAPPHDDLWGEWKRQLRIASEEW